MHPGARLVDRGGVAEEEERHAGNAAQDEYHGHEHEKGRCFESTRRDGAEVGEGPVTPELAVGVPFTYAVVEQAEVAGVRRVHAVADPVGLNEHHHIDNGKADGEDRPQDPDGPRVPHVVVMVDLGGFLRWQHFCSPEASPLLISFPIWLLTVSVLIFLTGTPKMRGC